MLNLYYELVWSKSWESSIIHFNSNCRFWNLHKFFRIHVRQGMKSKILFEPSKKREVNFIFVMILVYFSRTTFFFYDFWTSNKQNIFLFSQGMDDAIVIAPAKNGRLKWLSEVFYMSKENSNGSFYSKP